MKQDNQKKLYFYSKWYLALTLLLFFSLCTGCSSWYSYGNKRYDTKNEALQAQKSALAKIASSVSPKDVPLYDKALVILPSYKAIETRGLFGATDQLSADGIDYLVKSSATNAHFMADLLKQRRLFTKVDIKEALYPGVTAYDNRTSYDAVIYVKLPGSGKISTFLVTATSTEEKLLFMKNSIPSTESGYHFWLKKIEQTMQDERASSNRKDILALKTKLEKQMKSEQPMKKNDENESDLYSDTEKPVGSDNPDGSTYTYFVNFNPFSYEGLHDSELGQNETVAILAFPDKRQSAGKNDTHIGTIYGMIYHNPLFEVYSSESVHQAIPNVMETLFMANGFQVKKYPDMKMRPKHSNARFFVKGQTNKLWTKVFHSAEAEVDIDIEIFDSKLNKTVWTGKIAGYESKDPKETTGLTNFLNTILGDAINIAWNNQGMKSSFETLRKEALTKTRVNNLEKRAQANSNNEKVYLELGIAYYEMRKYKEAIKALKYSIQIKPDYARPHYYLGLTYLVDGDKDAAVAQYDILKVLDENFARKLFADIYE